MLRVCNREEHLQLESRPSSILLILCVGAEIYDTCILFVCSTFADIFDESHFIKSLSQQVRVLRALPQNVMDQFENASMIYKISKVKAWSLPRFYLENALPELKERG